MQRFGGIIFDMDGLLLDSERIALDAFNCACGEFGLGYQQAVFMRCVGTNRQRGEQIIRAGLAGQVDLAAFIASWDTQYAARTVGVAIPVKAGAVALLQAINKLGLPVAVATSTATELAQAKLQAAGLLHFFQHIVGGDQVARSKPEPDIYLHAARLLAVSPAAALALEDSENGVLAALAAGMTVVQVPDLVQPYAALRARGQHVLASLEEVPNHRF